MRSWETKTLRSYTITVTEDETNRSASVRVRPDDGWHRFEMLDSETGEVEEFTVTIVHIRDAMSVALGDMLTTMGIPEEDDFFDA